MAFQFSTAARNGALDAIETAIGVSAIMKIRTGAAPADCATADSGTVLATINLPSDWLAAAASGAKSKSGTWEDTAADAAGTAGHFRVYDSGGSTCHIQGSCGIGSGDLQLDNTSLAVGQDVLVTAFTINAGGA
jgi:hypothetical protein